MEEQAGKSPGRTIHVVLRRNAIGSLAAEAQGILPFGHGGIFGESLGLDDEGQAKEPVYEEAIANLKDLLAYCHVWGRMSFDTTDPEAREVVEALVEEAMIITSEDSRRVLGRLGIE
ncbi:MAG: hypothetical protein JOZ19_03450 [Rubrobacter sp.]|nr:hypothetical protein [Rubrobacter sp.]